MNHDDKRLLETAVSEIRHLRKQNELMGARLDMFDKMMILFHTPPCFPGGGYSPDLTYEIEKHIEANKEAT